MNPLSDFYREIFQRLLANAFAVQERRELSALLHAAQLKQNETRVSERPISDNFQDLAPPEEVFVPPPEFLMLPENEHSLYARSEHILAEIMELPVFRHSAHLARMLTLKRKVVTAPRPPLDIAPAVAAQTSARPNVAPPNFAAPKIAAPNIVPRIAPTPQTSNPSNNWSDSTPARLSELFVRRAANLHWPRTLAMFAERSWVRAKSFHWPNARNWSLPWRSFFPANPSAALKARANSFSWPTRWRRVNPLSVAAVLLQRAKTLSVPDRWRSFKPTRAAAKFAHKERNFRWPGQWHKFTGKAVTAELAQRMKKLHWPQGSRKINRPTVSGGFGQRAQNLTWTDLRRNLVPGAVVAVVLAFSTLLVYNNHESARSVQSSALTTPSPVDRQPSLPKPSPGSVALMAQSALPSQKPATLAKSAPRRVRAGSGEVEYIGDDVVVRTFPDKHAAKPARAANSRITNIGDDVTVRYFAPQPATRNAVR
jgi:hypothetical protein